MEGKIVEDKKKMLFHLFISTLYLSTFTFGGGYVIVSLLKKKFVDEYHWIENDEMLDLVAIAQSAPGAIAVNGAIIACVTYEMGNGIAKGGDKMSLLIMAGAFVAACFMNVNVIYIILTCIIFGVVRTLLKRRKEA